MRINKLHFNVFHLFSFSIFSGFIIKLFEQLWRHVYIYVISISFPNVFMLQGHDLGKLI